ncbi:DUF6959 family protein [Deinococcus roseus]|uniref:Uncharacterized protein n=1 Tax=Deinococcus roseus TaxID=392414 RepID=A0ABQ2D3U2_9DEIO|nr:hypothetical protein [Deinococcus roseus]GGJ36976.1 hypothetical protein GCM10008938_23760 [Deinococcus roseus]
MKTEVEILYHESDGIVFKSALRRFPSIALQGDTLSLLYFNIEELKEMIDANNIDIDEASYLIDRIYNVVGRLNDIYNQFGEEK